MRGPRDDSIAGADGPADTSELPATAVWRLPGDLGRRYGGVSGDLNPIHLHPWSAKRFGFPTAIAHGMWTAARCLAQLGSAGAPDGPFRCEVAFRRPIRLPAKVCFAESPVAGASDGDSGVRFGVREARTGTPHLDGRLMPGI